VITFAFVKTTSFILNMKIAEKSTFEIVEGISISGLFKPEFAEILTEEALQFIKALHEKFNPQRLELLEKRKLTQLNIDKGIFPDFMPETKHIREDDWKVAELPTDLLDRRVEITGPVDRKMIEWTDKFERCD